MSLTIDSNAKSHQSTIMNPKAQKYIVVTMGSLAAFFNAHKVQPLVQRLESKKSGEYHDLMKEIGIFQKNFGHSMPLPDAAKKDFHMRQNVYRYSISALKSLKTASIATFAATQGWLLGQATKNKA